MAIVSVTTFVLCSGLAFAGGKAGTDGTATSYDDSKGVLLVVDCEKNAAGEWKLWMFMTNEDVPMQMPEAAAA
jgi:ABC-type glycerol-3-phosphate transport system substrate-binding protein